MNDHSRRPREYEGWLLFCLSILLLKLALFAMDPTPKLFLGDSWSYIQTALSDWIPEARSYFYGYVIRWSSVWTESLTSLLVLQLDTVLLPVIAFSPAVWRTFRHGFERAVVFRIFGRLGSHLLISMLLMFVLHEGYKRTNGWISHRPPAYLHAAGIIQLAVLSPVLEPEDSPDPGLADVIRKGDEFHLKDLNFRAGQRFSPGYLIDRF